MSYDPNNIFAKILRQEIPCDKVYENDHVLAFNDIAPHAPTHILVIPKGAYTDASDFSEKASSTEKVAFMEAIGTITTELKTTGYRLIANTGLHGGQEVPHFHMHILGGKPLGPMLQKS